MTLYEKQTEYRDQLRMESREVITEIVQKINANGYDNPVLEEKLKALSKRLSRTTGKDL